MADTLVTFASGTTSGRARVLQVVYRAADSGADSGRWLIVDETPLHPVDHT